MEMLVGAIYMKMGQDERTDHNRWTEDERRRGERDLLDLGISPSFVDE